MNAEILAIIVSIIIFIVGSVISIIIFKINASQTRASVYFEFQGRYKEFQKNLPNNINDKNKRGQYCYRPKDNEESLKYNRSLQAYWWLVFDEWLVCCNESKFTCKRLWKRYYKKGVLNAMKREDFVDYLKQLLKKEDTFLGKEKEFAKELEKIHRRSNPHKAALKLI